jgi:hypothetical protein
VFIDYDRARFAPESIHRRGDQLVMLLRAMIGTLRRGSARYSPCSTIRSRSAPGYSGTDRSRT